MNIIILHIYKNKVFVFIYAVGLAAFFEGK